ncbi:MAG: 30S ribosomal protein S1 [Omnitrophica bacterium RIFCSPLOWO2_12_FULL_44_17]|uniref:30S ribosomal protein S1 n=1 Tax=Candidatus Danuiimicrobium aquiferis TaxID=1801832 RepID=A0A1G1L1I2_9BACT|nr:MAG: 30S ribosomal protein S1 [Omnitrophica bacterium RIFCSPHIGHO2_02_FULL_45_28]OGW89951.1 MAG: 30S ribosomal protein S1 [Omnitrophica bacterium RIFCSPHIGHO2_12_FULL_44_12]OGW99001.1 MAG: 30S ribosomal protein S1 [Omnitrophica bacterium RIFCSPLOWO2_12_FULL_44_17]OGX04180.1 MAG: 30S ribosomal protein S1 [Omnitrophica bacterium RIFCSPLOWO2_02_FULL_44_11]
MSINNENAKAMSFSDLYENSIKDFKEGQIVKGKIVAIRENEAIIDIGYKSEGVLQVSEFMDPASLKVGDEVEVLFEAVEDEDGMLVLSKRKADRQKCWDQLISGSAEGSVVEGRIFRKVRGGFMVDIGMEAFLPASLVELKPVKNLDQYLGKDSKFLIVKVNHKRKNIVVSRKDLLEREKEETKHKMVKNMEVGQIVKGRVKNITDFGAFIELGGVDGLLHITDLSWGRVSHPSEILSIGDEIDVKIIAIDRESEKVSLGLKQITQSPWEHADEKYSIGTKITGRVTNILPYGAFVELEPGIEGLIHISELSWTKRVTHPSEVLKVGDQVEAVILSVDKDAKKISMGLKQMSENPWDRVGDRYHGDDEIEGTVRNITDYGIFVELEPGIDGLIHVSDISWLKKLTHPSEVAKKGDKIKAKILSLDPDNRKVSLGVKQLTEDPWTRLCEELRNRGTEIKGKITKIVNFGVFVELENGLEGLVHISEIPSEMATTMETSFHIGDEIKVQVINIDDEQRKIALSVKNVRRSA